MCSVFRINEEIKKEDIHMKGNYTVPAAACDTQILTTQQSNNHCMKAYHSMGSLLASPGEEQS